jgi:glycogen(starch) synthase
VTAERPALFPSAFHPHVGGVEELTRQLALEQTRRGKHPLILANQWPRELSTSDSIDDLAVRRVPFRVPGPRPRQLAGWALYGHLAQNQTAQILREWKADVVHVQCVSSNATFATRASRRLDLPLVISAQGELSMDSNHVFDRSMLARTLLRRVLDRADIITGCSRYVVDELDRFSGGKYRSKMRVIYNGIDVEECARAAPYQRERPYILGLGRLVREKGYDILIRAFEILAKDFPDHDLLIAGDGPQMAQLRALIMSYELDDRVNLLGTVDHRIALDLMAGAAAFALCSRNEPMGIVVLEAMAVGAPVVASAVGGVPEIVDGTNGLLYQVGDQQSLVNELRQILDDSETAADLRRAGLSTAAGFSWTDLAAKYDVAYSDAGA